MLFFPLYKGELPVLYYLYRFSGALCSAPFRR